MVTDFDSLKKAQNYRFNHLDLSKILKGSLKMLTAARVEPAQMQTINDLVQSLFTRHTKSHFFKNSMVFAVNMLALLTQMFVTNDPADEHFRTGAKARWIYLMLAISSVCNAYLGRSEFYSNFGADG